MNLHTSHQFWLSIFQLHVYEILNTPYPPYCIFDVYSVSLLHKNFGKSTAYSCRTNILIWFHHFKKKQYTQLKTKQVKQINYNLWVFLNWETVLRESMQVYNDDDVNVTATDLRLTKTRSTSFNNKHNLF